MKKINKNPRYYYKIKLLQEFDQLKDPESQLEVLEYTRFIKDLEKQERKLRKQTSTALNRTQ